MPSVKKRRREELEEESNGSNNMSGFPITSDNDQLHINDYSEGQSLWLSEGPSQPHNGNWRQYLDVLKLFQQLTSAKHRDFPYEYFITWQDPALWMMMILRLFPGVPTLNCPTVPEFKALVVDYSARFSKGVWSVGFEAQILQDYMHVFTETTDLGPLTDSTFSVYPTNDALVVTSLNNQGVCPPPPHPQEPRPITDSEEARTAYKLVKALKPFQSRFPGYAMAHIEDNMFSDKMNYNYFLLLSYSEREEYLEKWVDLLENGSRNKRPKSRRHR